jgi:hypothetical protein
LIFTAVCFFLVLVVAWIAIDARPRVLANHSSDKGKFILVNKAGNKLDVVLRSWSAELWWQRSNSFWACYSLAYESSGWSGAVMRQENNHLVVERAGQRVADLSLEDYRLTNVVNGSIAGPAFLTTDDPLDSRGTSKLYPESTNWEAAFAHFKK